ncbi:hypothetical protein CC86DRAFT_336146 [Ophiobolus disseminans]|uniref:Uncharacterized protein n=1 Tax=Ophiobolus disseminans TaxID=1469910 RepID=A0A6A6ZFC2_9PLEO|nr:hypothetical protein CC86DRAFT_336146 [Ophiobolus disseminans]
MDEPARKRRKTSSPPAEMPSSPLRKPPRRPSFASPTKASLARNYPSLLPSQLASAGSPSRPSSRSDTLARGKQAREDATVGAQQRATTAQNVTPRARRVGGHRSPPNPTDEEPELPATPSQRGLEDEDEPRRGVLYSSPSKRPPRAKGPVKQSSLRPKAPPVQEASPTQHIEDGPEEADARTNPGKRQPPDPELEKRKQEKARLEREVAEVEAQVSRCLEEITKEQQRSAVDVLRTSERSDLQGFIAKVSGADSKADAVTPVSTLLCSFLPFSTLAIPLPRRKNEEKPIASHRPVELADPLPYLEMFTSMKYSTHVSLPRGKIVPSSRRVQQKHTIDIVGPQKLLTAQISLIIDVLVNQVIDMHILRLSPWAERELGTYLRKRAEEKDLSNACWAIESYFTIAQKRAQYWHRCETTYAHLLAGHTRDDTENARPPALAKSKMSRKDINRHLGRDSLILQDSHVLLKLNWRIGFDWTGEAESQVTVDTAFPSVWTEADTAKTFSKVPETFASLLQGRGAFEATRVMAALLFKQ